MNLWLVGERQYVVADGSVGAAYLANAPKDESVRLIALRVEQDFNPRLVSVEEAKKLLNVLVEKSLE